MSDDDHPSPSPFSNGAADPSRGEHELRAADSPAPWTFGQLAKRFLLQAAALLGSFVLFSLLLTGGAGWYTSRSQFCSSCHIMEPYYTSWQESSHSHVACTKCHFPPGAGEKVRGKLLGLVQLVKYATASQGPRPAAEIPDASCLRSGCHERRLLSGRVDFHGIPFDHRPHLEDLQSGKQLRCTSCHSQIVQGAHMTVTTSTCFLCHFKNGLFNEGLGACTRCHQIPEQEFDLGGGVTFHHDLAYEKGVGCANCHGDLIRGNGAVPEERCSVCHNREDDLKRIQEDKFIHQVHVADHKVDCLACHLRIQHTFDPHRIANAVSDCQSCHPDHHHEQVSMLQGMGGRSVPAQPGGMTKARLTCQTCHSESQSDDAGTVLMTASLQTCVACHDDAEIASLVLYHAELKDVLAKLSPHAERIRRTLDAAELNDVRRAALVLQLDDAQHDLDFLQTGNGFHNSHYASTLAVAVLEQLTLICGELNIDPPDVPFPEGLVSLPSAAEEAAAEEEPFPAEKAAKEAPPDDSPTTEPPEEKEPSPAEKAPEEAPVEKEPSPAEKAPEEAPAEKEPPAAKESPEEAAASDSPTPEPPAENEP